MPIPASSDEGSVTGVVLALFLQVHRQLRDELRGLDRDALNWVPTLGANSIATIVTHVVGSESETLSCVAGLPCERDREAEFVGGDVAEADVLALLDTADDLVRLTKSHIDDARLGGMLALPTLPDDQVRSGLTWLVGNYGHAREHIGHIQLTKQLYQGRGAHVGS
jgi:DinB superfamily